jgi:hypothetical protein
VLTSEGLRNWDWANGLNTLSLRTKRSLRLDRLDWKMSDGNLGRKGLGSLGKSTMGINPTHLEVKVSPR